jgi:hypothetical protein
MTRRRRIGLAMVLAGALAGLGAAAVGAGRSAALDAPASELIVSCLACHDGLISPVALRP